MDQGQTERNRIRLISSERTVLELFLLVYLFLFITIDSVVGSHYLWLLLSTGMGIITYLLFSKVEYSLGIGILLAALLATPFYFNGLPLVVVFMLFVYSFWRLQVNFGETKGEGWPYLVLNTIFFTVFYFILKLFFVNANADELMSVQVVLYLLTTVIYFIIRFIVIGVIGWQLRNFNLVDMGKIFAAILGLGFITYIAVSFLMHPFRSAVIAIVGFLFSGLFILFGKGVTPLLDWYNAKLDEARARQLEQAEVESSYIDFSMQDGTRIFGATFSHNELFIMLGISITILVSFILIARRRKKGRLLDKDLGNTFLSTGRTKKKKEKQLVYDYSDAFDVVRTAYKKFEEEAQYSKVPRLEGETVKEWFSRMNWGHNEVLFNTYDKVRYGSHSVTEEEGSHFVDELDKIRHNNFKNNV
ncbi:hypothetical protein FQ087_10765 [Sporosarcina sp. ANT_H38]|uniref:hypothetical protein n=1 Tax=Sporosarcina sp. ANT_H38 TaxID=2597358 RepID=UPI0011F221C7|nr:hypothetical protein [Sporosarcina sp. ANT_H38]KAA0966679.1 hypothetical protein FQ087_10765 [Sporosarcina sp. ANT_H38]